MNGNGRFTYLILWTIFFFLISRLQKHIFSCIDSELRTSVGSVCVKPLDQLGDFDLILAASREAKGGAFFFFFFYV